MQWRPLVRDAALVGCAATIGWWAHSSGTVLAQRSGGDPGLAFQMIGTGPESTLALYNPGTRSLYVYPRAGAGASTVNCAYSFTIYTPGAAIERKTCPVGDLH